MVLLKRFSLLIIIAIIILLILAFTFTNKGAANKISTGASRVKLLSSLAANIFSPVKEQAQFENVVAQISPEKINDVEKILNTEAESSIKEISTNFDKILSEADREILNLVNPLLRQVKIDKNKKDADYIKEMIPVIIGSINLDLDFNDKKKLAKAGNYFRQKAILLSNIKPSSNFQSFHIFWITDFGSKAYILSELGKETNDERKYALLNILHMLTDLESQLVANFEKPAQ